MKENDNFYVSSIIGIRDNVERLLLTKGLSNITVDQIIEKIERIIALSGFLGMSLQREKDYEELRKMHLQIDELRKGN